MDPKVLSSDNWNISNQNGSLKIFIGCIWGEEGEGSIVLYNTPDVIIPQVT